MAPSANKPLLLYGGSFDPVHNAHIEVALAASAALSDAPVLFLPNARSPFKARTGATAEQRAAMLELALKPHPQLRVSRWEINQPPPSYTVHTLQHFRQQYPQRPLIFIMGADSFAKLHLWHQWQQFPTLCHLMILPRPQANAPHACVLKAFPRANAKQLSATPCGQRMMLNFSLLDISSTAIRANPQAHHSLPTVVADYIRAHHLYRAAP